MKMISAARMSWEVFKMRRLTGETAVDVYENAGLTVHVFFTLEGMREKFACR